MADDGRHRNDDTTNVFKKIDTMFIQNYYNMVNVRAIAVLRANKFSITDNISGSKLEYEINNNVNLGLGLSFKYIGFEFQFNPHGLNKDDDIYGKSTQFALSTGGNSRRFIYDAYFRYNQGFHTTSAYKIPNDTSGKTAYIYRPDIANYNGGFNVLYVCNNKRFSSSAAYSFTQRQLKSAGSWLLGGYALLYGIDADSVIFPDSLRKNFQPEVQFKSAFSATWGISVGYAYTFVFKKYWYVSAAEVPGLSFQSFYSVNAYDQKTHSSNSAGLAFQSKFSIGYNKASNFFGITYSANNYWVNNDAKASLNYKFSSFKIFFGHRFAAGKLLKKYF